MKIRIGFVSNSSSTSFIITNKTDTNKTLIDFVKENEYLLYKFKKEYDYLEDIDFNQETMIKNAKKRNEILESGKNYCVYGDNDDDILGMVYDYILREGGESKSFKWKFDEYWR